MNMGVSLLTITRLKSGKTVMEGLFFRKYGNTRSSRMSLEQYEIKQLEKELSKKEGRLIKILSVKGKKKVTICSYETYLLMRKMGVVE